MLLRPLLLLINLLLIISTAKKVLLLKPVEFFILENNVVVEFVINLQFLLLAYFVHKGVALTVYGVVAKNLVLDLFALNFEQGFKCKKRVLLLQKDKFANYDGDDFPEFILTELKLLVDEGTLLACV